MTQSKTPITPTSETPRTDFIYEQFAAHLERVLPAAEINPNIVKDRIIKFIAESKEHSRQLERELQQANEKLEAIEQWTAKPSDGYQKFMQLWSACVKLSDKAQFKVVFDYTENVEKMLGEANEKLAARDAEIDQLKQQRDEEYGRFLSWRGIEKFSGDIACGECGGAGVKTYASTATWHGGVGGQALTSGICDKCWGSGNSQKPWLNLRTVQRTVK